MCAVGCGDPVYDGVYRFAGDDNPTHCYSAHGRHLYLGPTGKWYLNASFAPGADTCKAFYHRKSRRPSTEGIGLPTGSHRWQYWQDGAWEEKVIRIEAVAPLPATDDADGGRASSAPASDLLSPEAAASASAAGRVSGPQQAAGAAQAKGGRRGKNGKAQGRFEQWLLDSQAATLSPREGGGVEGDGGAVELVPKAVGLEEEVESDSEDGEILVERTPEALRKKKPKRKANGAGQSGGGCCGSRPARERPEQSAQAAPPEEQPAEEESAQEPAEELPHEPDAVRQSFGRLGD